MNVLLMVMSLLMMVVVLALVGWAWIKFGPVVFIAVFVVFYLLNKLADLYHYITRKKN